jgi:hypothetical protein
MKAVLPQVEGLLIGELDQDDFQRREVVSFNKSSTKSTPQEPKEIKAIQTWRSNWF